MTVSKGRLHNTRRQAMLHICVSRSESLEYVNFTLALAVIIINFLSAIKKFLFIVKGEL